MMTKRDWDRVEWYVKQSGGAAQLDRSEQGTFVVIASMGLVLHPKAYLDLVAEHA